MSIQFIDNPTKLVQLEAIKQDGIAIDYFYRKGIILSDNLKILAIKQNFEAIRCIRRPTKEIQLYAVKENINSIFYIKDPDHEVAFYCIISNPELLKITKSTRKYDPCCKKLQVDYFQNLPLKVQKMLVEYDVYFTLAIPNLHPDLKTELTNVRNMGLF